MSEKNESVADVPAEGNSAGFFDSANVTSAKKAAKNSWPWAAVAAVAVVAGIGGYAIGQNGGFDHRPANFQEMLNDGPMGQMNGGKPGHHMDGGMRGNNMPGPGMMDNDGDGNDDRGIDPDGDNWTGTNKAPAPSTSPSSTTK